LELLYLKKRGYTLENTTIEMLGTAKK
jgi:hypothetical protein